MLLSKSVKMKWVPRNKDYYKNKGYIYTKMQDIFDVRIGDLPDSSNKKVEVKCDGEDCSMLPSKDLNWYDYFKCVKEHGKYYCQKCAIRLYGTERCRKTQLSKSKSFEQECIENNRLDILDRWDYALNKLKPSEVSFRSTGFNKKGYYFKCDKHPEHHSELKNIDSFSGGEKGSVDCDQCNSFAQYLLDTYGENALKLYWSDKNIFSPWEISKNNGNKVWIKCQNKCNSNHDDYEIRCSDFTSKNSRCTKCAQEKKESFLQEKVRLYLNELGYEILHEYDCNIIGKNPKIKNNRGKLPYDNEIVELKLIIETHGEQHYKLTGFHKMKAKRNNTTPEYEFHMQKLRDRYKRIYAKYKGYDFLEIPYWTEKTEEWKELINNKIKI
jgi:hypothetical protein